MQWAGKSKAKITCPCCSWSLRRHDVCYNTASWRNDWFLSRATVVVVQARLANLAKIIGLNPGRWIPLLHRRVRCICKCDAATLSLAQLDRPFRPTVTSTALMFAFVSKSLTNFADCLPSLPMRMGRKNGATKLNLNPRRSLASVVCAALLIDFCKCR